MNLKDDGEGISKRILDWWTGIITLAAALSTIIGVFFSDDKKAQQFAYIVAVVLIVVSGAIYLYQRRRAARLKIAESLEPLSASAALRGLLPFEEGDQLPGRARDVQEIYTLVASSAFRFGVLWGESGCGKTSLLRAGLTPKLRNEKFIPLYISKPTKEPQKAIRSALTKEIADLGTRGEKNLNSLLKAAAPKGKKIVILFDQFEEFFLTNRTPSSRAGFVEWLGNVVNDENLPVTFLIGIRADFFAQLQNFAPQIPEPTSARSTYQLQNFDTEQAKQIFSAAAKADGIPFEPALIQAVVKELDIEEFIRPAELQVVGTRLKRKNIFTLNKYEALGGARGILSSYIGEEIKQSPSEHTARLILRLMCADIVETKSQTDLSLNDILGGVSGTEQTKSAIPASRPEEIQAILNQFVAARVLIHTDDDKYNLVHDYLAPYVRTATEGTETNTERANRMLKRYVAEYKEDSKTRIPFGRLRWIQKYASAEARSGVKPKELIKKSQGAFYGTVAGIVAIPLLLVSSLYFFLANSYYIGFESFGDPNRTPYLVIRTGNPQLSFLPGFDRTSVQTDFTMDDLSSDSPEIAEEILREEVTGLWYKKTEAGYQEWEEQLISRLSVRTQARALRWLGESERAENILLNNIRKPAIESSLTSGTEDQTRSESIDALVEHAQINPEVITPEILQILMDIAVNPKFDTSVRESSVIALRLLIQANPQAIMPAESLQKPMDLMMDAEADAALRSTAMDALIPVIQFNQPALIPKMVDALVGIITDTKSDDLVRSSATRNLKQLIQYPGAITPDLVQMLVYSSATPPSVRRSSAEILERLAQSDIHTIAPELFPSLVSNALSSSIDSNVRTNLQTALIKRAKAEPQWVTPEILNIPITLITSQYYMDASLRSSTQDTLIKLAQTNPQAITSDSLQRLIEFIMKRQGDSTVRDGIRNGPLTSLAQANPKAITPEMVQELMNTFFEAGPDPLINDLAIFAAQPLISANPQTVSPDTFERLLYVILDPKAIAFLRAKAEYAIGPLAKTNPALVTNENLKSLTALLTEPQINADIRNGAVYAIEKFAQANHQVVTSDVIQTLFEVIVHPQPTADVRGNATNTIGTLGKANPEVVTFELLQSSATAAVDSRLDSIVRSRMAEALRQLASAHPEAVKSELLHTLAASITRQSDPQIRANATYALGELARANPDAINFELLQTLMDFTAAPTADISARTSAVAALGQLAQANPKMITSDLLQTLMDFTADPKLIDLIIEKSDVSARSDIASTVGQLAETNPNAVTSGIFNSLMDIVSEPQLETSIRFSVIDNLSQIAQANRTYITPELLEAHAVLILDSNTDYTLRSATQEELAKLGQSNSQAITSELLLMLVDFDTDITNDPATIQLAATAIGNLAKANSKVFSTDVLLTLAAFISSSNSDTGPDQQFAAATALGQLAQSYPHAVTPDLLQVVTDLVTDITADPSTRADLAKLLGKLAQANPQAANDANTLSVLMDLLQKDTDSAGRSIAAYTIFEITFEDKSQETIIRKILSDEFLASPEPHLRIAATRLLEMMAIGNLYEEAVAHPEEREQIKSRLNNFSEGHLVYAASLVRGKIIELEEAEKETKTK